MGLSNPLLQGFVCEADEYDADKGLVRQDGGWRTSTDVARITVTFDNHTAACENDSKYLFCGNLRYECCSALDEDALSSCEFVPSEGAHTSCSAYKIETSDKARHSVVNKIKTLPKINGAQQTETEPHSLSTNLYAPEDVSLVALDDPEFTDTFLAPLVPIAQTDPVQYVTPFYAANLEQLPKLFASTRNVLGMGDYHDTRYHVLRELLLLARRSLAVVGRILHNPIGVWHDHRREIRLTFLHTEMPNGCKRDVSVLSYPFEETFFSPGDFIRKYAKHIFPQKSRDQVIGAIEAALDALLEPANQGQSENTNHEHIEKWIALLDEQRESLLKRYEEPLKLRPAGNPLRGRSTRVESALYLA
ncbi:hypothetical protein CYMTET_36928 [Cymbomonas tetramitiformis]|uniref:Uncharacterized protein n=1 Tax=Cymbomonas tetramitiformis TaxID=36881 RepID=A0AAE0CF17_9CHLO|nr:hypothetical protein CYMTET_36928 [Cymbomonas tetramitiformis]